MDFITLKKRTYELINKYKYALLVLFIGIFLLLLPSKKEDTVNLQKEIHSQEEHYDTADQLSQILSKIDGAGEVLVYLSIASGEETLYQTDNDHSESGETSSVQIQTVIISNDSGETGLIRQVNPPMYKGALVLCQGANNPQIQLAIVDAVSKVTGLGANKIAVLKMK